MDKLRNKQGFICDMDGVLYHGNILLPGVKEFVEWLYKENKKFLFLTNGSGYSPKELQLRLKRMGLDVDEKNFYTSALATAKFVSTQKPGCSAYVIGEPGLYNALHDVGVALNNIDPDYVIIGETSNYNYDSICKAVTLVNNGAKLVGLSALMTTTVKAMEETIALLRGTGIPVMCGGAVLTEDFSAQIGADYYAKDAQAAVAIVKKVIG